MEQTAGMQQSGKTAQLVHWLLTHIQGHPGERIQVMTRSRLTMEHLARVVFFTAGFPKYGLAVKDVSLADTSTILFENGTEVSFSLVVPEHTEED